MPLNQQLRITKAKTRTVDLPPERNPMTAQDEVEELRGGRANLRSSEIAEPPECERRPADSLDYPLRSCRHTMYAYHAVSVNSIAGMRKMAPNRG